MNSTSDRARPARYALSLIALLLLVATATACHSKNATGASGGASSTGALSSASASVSQQLSAIAAEPGYQAAVPAAKTKALKCASDTPHWFLPSGFKALEACLVPVAELPALKTCAHGAFYAAHLGSSQGRADFLGNALPVCVAKAGVLPVSTTSAAVPSASTSSS